jgi:LuxR family transcriptional regulator, maltose regulon positive regulatory protein
MPPSTATAARPRPDLARNGSALLESNRRPPAAGPGLVPRDRIVGRLLASPNVPLVMVAAPAGFGKTTLLAEWAGRDARPFVWLALDAADNDARRLTSAVAHAVDGITRPAVLVLEDLHLVHHPDAMDLLTAVVNHLPAGSQLALTSRTEPPLPTGHLRAHRKLIEVRTAELAMTHSEATALLAMAGLDLDSGQVAALMERTEGWPAGLYLAALAIRDQPDTDQALAKFAGNDRIVADYLHDELLSHTPRPQLEFLMRASVLDRLSGPLCDAVLERDDSARALAELARSNLLLVRLDRRDEWYRYHTLLSGTLRGELRRLEPQLERELHRRASAWHADHGDPDRAISHAIAARDPARVGELLWNNIGRYVLRGRHESLVGWLGELGAEEVAREPGLALVAATSHLIGGDGDRLRHWTSVAARDATPPLDARVSLMRAAQGENGMPALRDEARRAYRLEREDSPLRSLCCLLEGVARQLTDDRDGARAVLLEGARRGAVDAPTIQTLCLAQLALLALDDDDLDGAADYASRARTQAERLGIGEDPAQASVFAASALVRATGGRVVDAARDLRRAQRLLAALGDYLPWYEVEVRVVIARAALRLSDVRTARRLLAEAARFVRRAPGDAALRDRLEQVSAQADAASDSAGGDGWALTTAELRVLRFLPSHLSFPEVAKRLCVSPNTVKTHARAVYRKLDSSSRAEAVSRARDAGLLD